MGGLLGSLLGGLMAGGQAAPQAGGPDLGSILGGLLGGQAPQSPQQAPQSGEPDLGSILGGLLGGQATQSPQANSDDVLVGGLSQGNIPTLPSSSSAPSNDDPVVLGSLSGDQGQPQAQSGQPDLGSLLGALLGGQSVAPQSQAAASPDPGAAAGTVLLEGLLRGLGGGGGR